MCFCRSPTNVIGATINHVLWFDRCGRFYTSVYNGAGHQHCWSNPTYIVFNFALHPYSRYHIDLRIRQEVVMIYLSFRYNLKTILIMVDFKDNNNIYVDWCKVSQVYFLFVLFLNQSSIDLFSK